MKHRPDAGAERSADAAALQAAASAEADSLADAANPAVRIGRRVTELRRERGLSLSELAALLDISVRHLSRAVRQAKGVSVHRWIVDRRLAEARRLLSETDLPIHEIALRCAFHSAAAFSAAFRSASGYAPGEFRRLTLGRS